MSQRTKILIGTSVIPREGFLTGQIGVLISEDITELFNDISALQRQISVIPAPVPGFITSIDNTGNDVLLTAPGGVLSANLASVLISQFTNDAGYITSAGTPSLLSTQIAFGSGANLMTSSADLTWNNTAKDLTANGTIALDLLNSANVFYVAQGNVGFWYTGTASTGLLSHRGFGIDLNGRAKYTMGDVGITNNSHIEVDDVGQTTKVTTLAGVGTRMVTASAAGVLSTAAIPSVTPANVTAGSTKISLGGTPTGAALQAFSIDVTEANLTLNNIGGTLVVSKGGTGATTAAAARAALGTMWTITLTAATTAAVADATTYYFGTGYSTSIALTTAARRQYKIPFAGVLRGATIVSMSNAGSSETFTVYARINNATDVALTTTMTSDGTGYVSQTVIGLNTALAADDLIECKVVTPTWVTNPTTWTLNVVLYIE